MKKKRSRFSFSAPVETGTPIATDLDPIFPFRRRGIAETPYAARRQVVALLPTSQHQGRKGAVAEKKQTDDAEIHAQPAPQRTKSLRHERMATRALQNRLPPIHCSIFEDHFARRPIRVGHYSYLADAIGIAEERANSRTSISAGFCMIFRAVPSVRGRLLPIKWAPYALKSGCQMDLYQGREC
jgi:hypothetical protein